MPDKSEDSFYVEPRHFNNILIKDDTVIKTSTSQDFNGELYWYSHIPPSISHLFPKSSINRESLVLEKIIGLNLSYLYVNSRLTGELLLRLLETISILHQSLPKPSTSLQELNIYSNYKDKLSDRYENYDYSTIDKDAIELYVDIYDALKDYEYSDRGRISVIHGDPVFTNIILDVDNNFKFIDMRGKLGDTLTIYGDSFYDYAKMYQSLVGYDFILSGTSMNTPYMNGLIDVFTDYITRRYGNSAMNDIRTITKSLLFSLIPLHNNDKCKDYYALINTING